MRRRPVLTPLIAAAVIAAGCDDDPSGRPDDPAGDAAPLDAPSDPPDGALPPDGAPPLDAAPACAFPGWDPASPPPPDSHLRGVWVGPDAVWAIGEAGEVGRRSPSAGSWCWSTPAPGASLHAIWGTGSDDVWIVGDRGLVLRWDGAGFATLDVGTTAALVDVWASGPANVLVVGDRGIVRRFDGVSWSAIDLGERTWSSVWGLSAIDIWIGGSEPAPFPGDPRHDGQSAIVYRWLPAAGTWIEEARFTLYNGKARFHAIHGTSPDDVWAIGTALVEGYTTPWSAAFRFDGITWDVAATPDPIDLSLPTFTDVLAVGTDVWITGRDATRHYDNVTWTVDHDSVGMSWLDGRAGEVWGVGWPRRILRWDGARWVPDAVDDAP